MSGNESLPSSPSRKARNQKNKEIRKSKLKRFLLRLLLASVILSGALGIGTMFALWTVYKQLPDVRQLENYTLPMATEIYTESGKLLTRISSQGRYDPIALKDLPKHVQDAVTSAEDRRFWQHVGVDYLGLGRAIFVNLRKGHVMMGASTITQQLIKNLFLTPEPSAKRKIAEALLAFQLERNYSKEQILEMYLNLAFLGHNVYGVEAASQIYFGKSARNISVAEAALLAGIIRSPEYYSPYYKPDKANALKEIVIKQMARDKLITPEQLDEALKAKIHLVGLRTAYPYPYFLDYVMYSLREQYGDVPFRQGGWKVYTTLDPALQAYGERLLAQQLKRLQSSGANQAALVSVDPRNGFIRSLVGGVSYQESQFNRAFQAQRQVGSTFKPFVYLTAFEAGKTLQDKLKDEPVSFGGYRPRNWDHRFHGEVSLLQALTMSMNVPTVKLASQQGIYNVIQTARKAGVTSPIAADLTSALGSSEMTLLELTGAYATFANEGVLVRPTAISKIVDASGNVIYEHFPSHERVFQKSSVGQLNLALKNVVQAGTGTGARIGRPVAGKTGTTDQAYDTWFVGYVPQLVTGVWAGNDQPSATRGGGGSTCAPIWRLFMQQALRGVPVADFDTPVIQQTTTQSSEPTGTPDPLASNSLIEIAPETQETKSEQPTKPDSAPKKQSSAETSLKEEVDQTTLQMKLPEAKPVPSRPVVQKTPAPEPTVHEKEPANQLLEVTAPDTEEGSQ